MARTYHEAAASLAKAMDIAIATIRRSKTIPEQDRDELVANIEADQEMVLQPKPGFAKLSSLAYLESDFIEYWNEESGPDVEAFWKELSRAGLRYERKDVISSVLENEEVRTIQQFDWLIDNLLEAVDARRVTKTQQKKIHALMAEFEARKTRATKKTKAKTR
jgi:hypothetical protein